MAGTSFTSQVSERLHTSLTPISPAAFHILPLQNISVRTSLFLTVERITGHLCVNHAFYTPMLIQSPVVLQASICPVPLKGVIGKSESLREVNFNIQL